MKRRILLLLVALTPLFALQAQDGKPLGLKECVDIALQNNLRVRRSVYNVKSFDINLLQSKMNFLPSANLGGSFGLNYGRAINPVTNDYIDRNTNVLNTQLNGSWILFNGLRIQNTFRQNKKDYEASNQDLEKAKNDVIINVVTLYINVIFNKELLENAKFQLSSSQNQLDRITRQVSAGALPKANQLNQEALVATNEVNLINQENSLNLSILQLKQSMQLPSSTPLDVIVPELNPEDLVLEQNPDEIYQQALESMPEIRSTILKVQSAEYALKASKGNLYPRLTLNAGLASNYSSASDVDRGIEIDSTPGNETINVFTPYFMTAPPGIPGVPAGTMLPVMTKAPNYTRFSDGYGRADQLQDNLFKQVSLVLTVPIFNNWQAKSNVQRAAVNHEIARLNQIETENTLRQTIETAYNDALAASKTYGSSVKQVNAREEAARMNQQRFEMGAISFVENQISENDLFQSRSDLTRAKYNFIFKKKILDFYQGKKIEY